MSHIHGTVGVKEKKLDAHFSILKCRAVLDNIHKQINQPFQSLAHIN